MIGKLLCAMGFHCREELDVIDAGWKPPADKLAWVRVIKPVVICRRCLRTLK
jgi:hypothetical protein